MAYIYRKVVGDNEYYYLRASKRQGSKIVAKDVAYLGSTLDEARLAISKLPARQVRDAYKTINSFLERNTFLERVQELKIRSNPFIPTALLEQVEACKLHWQSTFKKHDPRTQEDYLRKFVIELAYNTTSIEGNTITLKEAQKLLTENRTPKDRTVREVLDVQNTEKVFMNITKQQPAINNQSIIDMHAALLVNIDPRVGYRTADVHVIRSRFDATPFPYIKTDMDLLSKWLGKQKDHPLVIAGIFHHKFEKIHPFFDGNGRVGRLLLNTLLLKDGYPPLIIRKRNRNAYLDALRKADDANLTVANPKDYKQLIEFLAQEYVDGYWNIFL
jgi:Fic family protein